MLVSLIKPRASSWVGILHRLSDVVKYFFKKIKLFKQVFDFISKKV